ncbi:hypothetical protein ACFL0U_04465 [Pseudomonadota bacterium]
MTDCCFGFNRCDRAVIVTITNETNTELNNPESREKTQGAYPQPEKLGHSLS